MTRNEELAAIFEAAAQGAMAPYNFLPPPGYQGGSWVGQVYDGKSYDTAKSLSGALAAIGAVYRQLAKVEQVPNQGSESAKPPTDEPVSL
jgi:hypothetical protein